VTAAPPLAPTPRRSGAPTASRPSSRAPAGSPRPAPGPRPAQAAPRGPREGTLLVAVGALVLSACLPLARVFVGLDALLPVLGAGVAALLVDAACRRLGFGPLSTLTAQVLTWGLFVGLVFLPDTLLFGVVPTVDSLGAGRDLWLYGLELIQTRPAPAFPEPGLLLLAVTGVWAVTHAVDGLVFWLAAPIAATVLALVMWTVPLALAPPGGRAWAWAVPLLAAAAGLLLAHAGSDVERWGRWVAPADPAGLRRRRNPLAPAGSALTAVAIVAGTLLAGNLPGYDQGPWYELRGLGGTTLTTNPIVGIQQRLVAGDTSPVLRVTTPRPVYLRVTGLDVYRGEREEWTSDSIRGGDAGGSLPVPAGSYDQVDVGVEVVDLDGVLVPFPALTGRVIESSLGLRYDQRLGTFTSTDNDPMGPGDRFTSQALLSTVPSDVLALAATPPDPALIALPPDLPPQVAATARAIVDRAGATTRLDQALALQQELRSWTYSLEVPASHSGSAMARFLETRTGYCEQFAGTMAVMLRTLGIPARVAVGFTPGTPLDPAAPPGQPATYQVTLANAHAWVEVQFGEYGWVPFEPTPRSDGNVLVPSPANLTPAATVQQERDLAQQPVVDTPEDDLLGGDDQRVPVPPPAPVSPAVAQPGPRPWAAVAAVAAVLVLLAGALVALRRRAPHERPPLERVLLARARIGWLGAGLGLPAGGSETDGEYLARLVRSSAAAPRDRAATAAELLSRRVGQARWAPALPEGAAQVAEAAAAVLDRELTARLGFGRRLQVRGRALGARLGAAVGLPLLLPGRRATQV